MTESPGRPQLSSKIRELEKLVAQRTTEVEEKDELLRSKDQSIQKLKEVVNDKVALLPFRRYPSWVLALQGLASE